MTTFATIRTQIADEINRTDLNSQINLAINDAIDHYNKQFEFWFNQTTDTFDTVANQFNYGSADGVATDIREIIYAKIALSSNENVPLIRRTYDYVQTANVGNLTGPSSDYAEFAQNIYLYPVPDQVYTITLSYFKSYTDLSADSDTNDFTDNAKKLIIARAKWDIYNNIIKSYDDAKISQEQELQELTALQVNTHRRLSSRRVNPTTF